jgi:hypothetical protein
MHKTAGLIVTRQQMLRGEFETEMDRWEKDVKRSRILIEKRVWKVLMGISGTMNERRRRRSSAT